MILEGIVTSLNPEDVLNIAPMGPIVDEPLTELVLRPFQTSQTYQNLKTTGCGVFHVTDDVMMIARGAIGRLEDAGELLPAKTIPGRVIASACRWYEFELSSLDDSQERVTMTARVIHQGQLRDFFGFNRAKHAVLEAAILATRVHILSSEEIGAQLQWLKPLVEKTAGPNETLAFQMLLEYIADFHPTSIPPFPRPSRNIPD